MLGGDLDPVGRGGWFGAKRFEKPAQGFLPDRGSEFEKGIGVSGLVAGAEVKAGAMRGYTAGERALAVPYRCGGVGIPACGLGPRFALYFVWADDAFWSRLRTVVLCALS
ncbi:MAG: hypothetical protein AAF591_07030 [Verrucomicrobiota bacterium]